MAEEVVVHVKNVRKEFFIPKHSSDSIKESVLQAFKPKNKSGEMYHALRDITFDINKGDFFGVLGRNGAGKSTLLKILAEIYRPSGGSVKLKGKVVSFIELGVGFNGNLSGRENIYLNAALLGFSKPETDAMYDKIVDFAELHNFMDQKLKNYSSGMKVRLAFSVAIQAQADILILDEVLAVGDAAFQEKCYDYFRSLKRQKKTIIFVTHSMGAVREYCNKAVLIEDGRVVCEGDADTVANEYTMLFADQNAETSRYDGAVELNDISATISEKSIRVSVEVVANEQIKDAVLAIRTTRGKGGSVFAGTNTHLLSGGNYFNMKPGETKVFEFILDNVIGLEGLSIGAALKTLEDGRLQNRVNIENAVFLNNPRKRENFPIILKGELNKKESAK